jgi:hypothetical protein
MAFGIASVPALLLLGQELDRYASPLCTPLELNPCSQTLGCEKPPRLQPPPRHNKKLAFSTPILDF